jgi:hypothetical protein
MGIKSKVLPGPLTDLSAWVDFYTYKPTAGCQISTLIFEFFFMEGWSLLISHEKYIKDSKVLDHLGISP